MESAADYDEQSEVLFLFNEDPEEQPSQTHDPPHPLPPQPTPGPTTSQPTPSATTNISADQSFWAEVYTLQPPHALMGILTDLHVHRFVLHQHLDSLNALTDTPIGHQPLTDTLPPPVQRLIAIYHNNVQRIQSHTRLALNAIDTMARFPPAAYFLDPNLAAQATPPTCCKRAKSPRSSSKKQPHGMAYPSTGSTGSPFIAYNSSWVLEQGVSFSFLLFLFSFYFFLVTKNLCLWEINVFRMIFCG